MRPPRYECEATLHQYNHETDENENGHHDGIEHVTDAPAPSPSAADSADEKAFQADLKAATAASVRDQGGPSASADETVRLAKAAGAVNAICAINNALDLLKTT